MNPTQIVTEALLVVSILDGSMKSASVRRCLRAALSAMDEAQAKGTPLLDGTRRIELASETAERTLRDDLELPLARLPERIADWHASACGTLVITSDGSTLVVEATGADSALLLSERSSCEGMLTARERDVMRCVEDGPSWVFAAERRRCRSSFCRGPRQAEPGPRHLERYDECRMDSRPGRDEAVLSYLRRA